MEGTCERVSSWQGASIGIRLAPDEARKEPAVQPDVIVEAEFVELEVPPTPMPWQICKLYVPLAPSVMEWMNSSDLRFSPSIDDAALTRPPRFQVVIWGVPLQIGNITAAGLRTHLEVPDKVNPRQCKVMVIMTSVELRGVVSPTRALLLMCEVPQSARESLPSARLMNMGMNHPLRWLLLPWVLLLYPLIVGSTMGPMALLGGAALTLASIACLSFLIAVLIVIIQRRCLHCTRRWRRLWRLRRLQGRPSLISAAFGESGPCCICLGDSDSRDALIALLPCRHALHAACYANWVSADAYPSSSLICPVCRCRAEAIGKLLPLAAG
ncbi:unnamed protein product [Effrenium voratum]|nr:unnamed protein product [Effrenium voratum]